MEHLWNTDRRILYKEKSDTGAAPLSDICQRNHDQQLPSEEDPLIVESNTVYEVDLACIQSKRRRKR